MEKNKIGILTFHCADNFGAMLQAFGLKNYLRNMGAAADIIRYEPFFMTGRHWLFPYMPAGSVRRRVRYALDGGISNLRSVRAYFKRRANMKRFRMENLAGNSQRKLVFPRQLGKLHYSCYIVGSDQIWNPDITFGLREEYFGVFGNDKKEKAVAYAASLGKGFLPAEYDKSFAALVNNLSAVTVREKDAIPYVKRFFAGPVTAVLDPVFLLGKAEWEKIESVPHREGYVLLYSTELNKEMAEYAKVLAKRKKTDVVELRAGHGSADESFITDYTAGPAEFLGYIHNAGYVVTNSFHGIAFSIIYRRKFMAFLHQSLGVRIQNILRIHGLEDRIYRPESNTGIDAAINWAKVGKITEENIMLSGEFLMSNVGY